MKHKKKKLWLWVLLAALAAAVAGLAVWQWDNLCVAFTALTADEQTIESRLQLDQEQQQLFDEYQITVTPPDFQHVSELFDRTATAEEIKSQLGLTEPDEPPTQDAPQPTQDVPQPTQDTPQATQAEVQLLVNDCVKQLYAYRIDLMSQLGELRFRAVIEWDELPSEERTPTYKKDLIVRVLQECYELEAEADSNVKALLESYRPKLEALGADTAVLDQLWLYYCDDKQVEKAYYLKKYM